MAANDQKYDEDSSTADDNVTSKHFMAVPRLADICVRICTSSLVTAPCISPDGDSSTNYLTSLLKSEVFNCVSEDILTHLVDFYPDDIDDRCVQATCPPHLKRMTLKGCEKLTVAAVKEALHRVRALQYLDLSRTKLMDLLYDLDIPSTLTSLTLEECDTLTDSVVQSVLRGAPNLKHLNVSCCDNLTDKMFLLDDKLQHGREARNEIIFEDYECHLTSVDLSGCRGITSSGIFNLSTLTGPTLKHVNISSCRKVDVIALLYLCGFDFASTIQIIHTSQPDAKTSELLLEGLEKLHQVRKELRDMQEEEKYFLCDCCASCVEDIWALEAEVVSNKKDGSCLTYDENEENNENFLGPFHRICTRNHDEETELTPDEGCNCCAEDILVSEVGSRRNDDKCSTYDENVLVSNIESDQSCERLQDLGDKVLQLKLKDHQGCGEGQDNDDLDEKIGEEITVEDVAEKVVLFNQDLDSVQQKKYLKSKTTENNCFSSTKTNFDNNCDEKPDKRRNLDSGENKLDSKPEKVEKSLPVASSAWSVNKLNSTEAFPQNNSNGNVDEVCTIHSTPEDNLVLDFRPENVNKKMLEQDTRKENLTDFDGDRCEMSSTNLEETEIVGKENKFLPNTNCDGLHDNGKNQSSSCNSPTNLDNCAGNSPTNIESNPDNRTGHIMTRKRSDILKKLIAASPWKQELVNVDILSPSTLGKFTCMQMYSPDLISLDASFIGLKDAHPNMVMTCLDVFLQRNKNLTKFGFHWKELTNEMIPLIASRAEQLKDVSLADSYRVTSAGVQALGECCKDIQKLDLRGVCFISDSAVKPCLMNRKLEHLCLAECGISDVTLQWISECLAEPLESLDLAWCEEVTLSGLNTMFANSFPRLTSLNLRKGPVSNLTLDLLADHCPALTSLNLSFINFDFEDDAMINVAKKLPHLKDIDISWNSSLTDRCADGFLRFCPKLKTAVFQGIKRISSEPFLQLIEDNGNWMKIQCQLDELKSLLEQLRATNATERDLPESLEGMKLKLPFRSTVFAPNLTFLNLFYCDFVKDLHLAKITAVCRGSLKIKGYHGDIMKPSWISSLKGI